MCIFKATEAEIFNTLFPFNNYLLATMPQYTPCSERDTWRVGGGGGIVRSLSGRISCSGGSVCTYLG